MKAGERHGESGFHACSLPQTIANTILDLLKRQLLHVSGCAMFEMRFQVYELDRQVAAVAPVVSKSYYWDSEVPGMMTLQSGRVRKEI